MRPDRIGGGAEAEVREAEYLGRRAVCKVRLPKRYRHPDLDARIRQSRTRAEARLIREARRAGARTPVIYDIDVAGCAITMERVEGRLVKDVLDSGGDDEALCASIGRAIAMIHDAGICHGDLTTSNMILEEGGRVCLIDFSMGRTSADAEDMGVDLRLLERAFSSAHPGLERSYAALMDAYRRRKRNPEEILRKVEEIKGRGRYT
ncbi:MAG: Kae1-associated serine/threonine protein kinase [Candidatus Methanoplasma sp.]|jgi:TP53 regulating kinase-like protein/N6-L-threonylcarbamoyladenine synthase/protein kinase Bud32|nr:Kae1-associated serine/threonine protein kinase [Candidatus Methanoplasma sp.]